MHFFTVPTDEEISEHSPIGSVRQVAAPGNILFLLCFL